jgi:hypothetical protein
VGLPEMFYSDNVQQVPNVMVSPKPSCWEDQEVGVTQHEGFMSHIIHQTLARWLKTVRLIKVKFMSSSPAECIWRRMQINDQQAERQKKNLLQKALSFTARAKELMVQDSSHYPYS